MSSRKNPQRPAKSVASRKQTVDTVSGPSGLVEMAEQMHRHDVIAAVELANQYNNTGKEREITALLGPYEIHFPFEDKKMSGQYARLMGFGFAHEKRWHEAEHWLERGQKLFPESLDYLYGLTYVRISLREFERALESADAYIAVVDRTSDKVLATRLFNGAMSQRSMLYNYRGLCFQELGKVEEAIRAFKSAITADSKSHHAYLNMANLFVR